jgi:uncharacterized protein
VTVSPSQRNLPNYGQLVKFLFQPFLNSPEAVTVDCEYLSNRSRIWIRVAFPEVDRGTVFGRGGRNIYAIKTVLEVAAAAVGQSVYLDVYGADIKRSEDGDRPMGERPHRSGGGRRPSGGGGRYGGGGRRSGGGREGGGGRYRSS